VHRAATPAQNVAVESPPRYRVDALASHCPSRLHEPGGSQRAHRHHLEECLVQRLLATTLSLALLIGATVVGTAAAQPAPDCGTSTVQPPVPATSQPDEAFLTPVGTYRAAGFNQSAAEVVAFDAATQRIFTINGASSRVDVLDASDPRDLRIVGCLELGGDPTSVVAIRDGFAAVAYQPPAQGTVEGKNLPGRVAILDRDANRVATVTVGIGVDAVTITPDGQRLLTADEAEILTAYSGDPTTIPVGSVSVIDLPATLATLSQADVTVVPLSQLDAHPLDPHVRRSPRIPTFGQDAEPEYVVVSSDSRTAYVALQESSAIAVLDLRTLRFTRVFGLPVVDHSVAGFHLAPTDQPPAPSLRPNPADTSIPDSAFADPANTRRGSHRVVGMPMPDGIALLESDGRTFILTAEEGDAREWGRQYEDVARVSQLGGRDDRPPLCADAYTAAERTVLARLTVSTLDGLRPGAGCIEQLHALGTRGMGIYDAETGERVWHSGDDLERFGLETHPRFFNSNHNEASWMTRSDDKGPEPEYVEVGRIGDRTYAFVGLERASGIAVYDVTDPLSPEAIDYVVNRDFLAQLPPNAASNPRAGDLGPEGLDVVEAQDSPTRRPLLVVGNEVSHTTTVWEVRVPALQVAFAPIPGQVQPGRTVPVRFAVDADVTRAVVRTPQGRSSEEAVQRTDDGYQVLLRTDKGLRGDYRVTVLDRNGRPLGEQVVSTR
jgi:hypothetical protein